MKIFTIGFTKKSAEEFFDAVRSAGVKRIVDVRLNNVSQLAGFAKREDLRFLLKSVSGIDYLHMLDLAPAKVMLKEFQQGRISWPEYETAYFSLLIERKVDAGAMLDIREGDCLLCSEKTPEKCHRRLAAEYLAQHLSGLEIVHIF